MKKIYLLSAAACLFAFSANAQDNIVDGWIVDGAGSTFTVEPAGSVSPTLIKIDFTGAPNNDGGVDFNAWSSQFITPCWRNIGKQGDSFKLSFDILYEGEADEGKLRIASGKTYPWNPDFQQGSADFNTQIVNEDDQAVIYDADKTFPKGQWTTLEYDYFIGELGADSIRLEIDHGYVGGSFSFKNIKLEVAGKVVAEYFTEKGGQGGNTAVAEVAAIKAYVANDVLFASEAADVVVYNINGVAVKSAKNVTSLNVADLKSGLYIAKVGNATVKFVK